MVIMVKYRKEVMTIGAAKEAPSWPSWLMAALGMLWMGLFPLWQDGSYTRITRAKWLAMLVLTGVTAAAVITAAILLLCRGKRRLLRLHPAQLLGLGYLAWVGLSAGFGSMAGQLNSSGQLTVLWGAVRYEGLLTQSCYVAVFLLMSLIRVKLRPVLEAAGAAVLICTGVAALQYTGYNPLGLYPEGLNIRTTMEFQGTIGNIDILSAWLCLTVPALLAGWMMGRCSSLGLIAGWAGAMMQLCIEVQSGLIALAFMLAALAALMLIRPEYRSRGFAVLSGVMALLALYLTMEMPWDEGVQTVTLFAKRSRWILLPLAAGGACALLAWIAAKRPGKAVKARWIMAAAAAGFALILTAVYSLPMPQNTGLWELSELLHGRGQDSYGSERLGVWRLTLEMSGDNLLFGTGPDTFLYALRAHMAATEQSLKQTFDNPHNMLLAILSGSGLPALALFLALTGVLSAMALRKKECLPLGLGMWGYLVQGMFTFSICLTAPMFWAAMGMLTSLSGEREASETVPGCPDAASTAEGAETGSRPRLECCTQAHETPGNAAVLNERNDEP